MKTFDLMSSASRRGRTFLATALATLLSVTAASAMSITDTSPVTETFDIMGTTSNLPSGWRIALKNSSTNWATSTNVVTQQASAGAPTAGGNYNWGATGAIDRAVGSMTSGSFGSPNNLLGVYTNNTGSVVTNLTVSYKLERYRINTAAASVQFYYSTDGSTWTAVTAGDIPASSLPTGASVYGYPRVNDTVSVGPFAVGGITIANGAAIYLRWHLDTTGSSSQGIGVDDVSVTASIGGGASAPDPVDSLTATAASSAQIDVSWDPNAAPDPVMVAWATNNLFGIPSGSYVATNPISGGGTVLYVGAATSVVHSALTQSFTYYYRAWSVKDGTNYSTAVNADATTPVTYPPSVTITNPAAASNDVGSVVTAVTVQGTGVNIVGDMAWSNGNGGATGTFAGGATWEVSVPVNVGANNIVVKGTNVDGFAASASTLVVRAPLSSPTNATVWINEIHYDNYLGDTNEGIEVAGPAGTDLSSYALWLHDGNQAGRSYSTNFLTGTIPDEGCGYGAVWFAYPVNGVQNGPADGIALVKEGSTLVQFLSYEGSFVAGDGPASGYLSVDIGISETGEVAGLSLQLTGSGTNYADFTWTGPLAHSTGTLNTVVGQSIAGCLVNVAPVIAPLTNTSVAVGGTVAFDVTATDANDDTIQLYAESIPSGAVFMGFTNASAVTSVFTWASAGPAGVYTSRFVAADGGVAVTGSVLITVTSIPPTLVITNPALSPESVPFASTTIVMQGTADNFSGEISWVNLTTSGSGVIPAASAWTIPAVPLNVASNVIVVSVTNASSAFAVRTQIVVRAAGTVAPFVWINEINYDPNGTDVGEFVEVAGPAGTDLSAYMIVLYNGSTYLSYGTYVLTGTIDDEGCGYGAVGLDLPSNGIQNGAPDGLALVRTNDQAVLQFLSYEGVMSAIDGPAAGLTATAISVSQVNTNDTLQLVGSGNSYAQFTWVLTNGVSEHALNAAQVITPCGGGNDTDGDGVPDDWEMQNFGSLTNAPTGDVDEDGFDNLSEFIAGTQPTNGLSYLKLVDLVNSNVTGRAIVFETVTGRVYSVDVLTELPLGNWSNLLNGVPGTGGALNIDDAEDATNRHYRLGVQIAP